MTDFGGKLRQARERRGISLRQIAASTKISVAALEALERNNVSKLPGGIFSRAFVRSYAAEVGLDPDVTVREFLELFEQPLAEESTVRQPLSTEESEFESEQRMAGVVLKLVAVAIPLVGVILYFTLRSKPSPAAPEPTPRQESAAPAALPDAGQPSATAGTPTTPPATVPPPPALRALATGQQPSPALASAGRPAAGTEQGTALDLHPTGACWVTVTVDGRRAFARVMQPGERERIVVKNEAVVEVGDAGAFAYSLNGKEGAPLGAAGQVKTLRVTAPSTPR